MSARAVTCAAAALAVFAALAVTGAAGVAPVVLVSGPSPFAPCTVGGPGTNYVNAEVEPWVAVNPTNPNNIVAVYQQDRWSNGGAFDRASDPWVTFAPNGDAYQISLSASADLRTSAVLVSKSTNGGKRWS